MNDLVTLTSQRLDATAYTTGDIIADYAGITHHAINKTIREQLSRLERAGNGHVEFKMQRRPSGRMAKLFLLNEQQATLLITFLKNTPRVADFKEELVRQFSVMKRELIERQTRYEVGKEANKSLGAAVKASRIDMHGHQYSTFHRLAYKMALGIDTTKLKRARGIKPGEAITEYLTADEAKAVALINKRINGLLDVGFNYQEIKEALKIKGVIYQIRLTLPAKATTN